MFQREELQSLQLIVPLANLTPVVLVIFLRILLHSHHHLVSLASSLTSPPLRRALQCQRGVKEVTTEGLLISYLEFNLFEILCVVVKQFNLIKGSSLQLLIFMRSPRKATTPLPKSILMSLRIH
jgi:hypothetical protein